MEVEPIVLVREYAVDRQQSRMLRTYARIVGGPSFHRQAVASREGSWPQSQTKFLVVYAETSQNVSVVSPRTSCGPWESGDIHCPCANMEDTNHNMIVLRERHCLKPSLSPSCYWRKGSLDTSANLSLRRTYSTVYQTTTYTNAR